MALEATETIARIDGKKPIMDKAVEADLVKKIKGQWQFDPDFHEQHFSLFSDLMVLAFQTLNGSAVTTLMDFCWMR